MSLIYIWYHIKPLKSKESFDGFFYIEGSLFYSKYSRIICLIGFYYSIKFSFNMDYYSMIDIFESLSKFSFIDLSDFCKILLYFYRKEFFLVSNFGDL